MQVKDVHQIQTIQVLKIVLAESNAQEIALSLLLAQLDIALMQVLLLALSVAEEE